jgi:hypothetical protein
MRGTTIGIGGPEIAAFLPQARAGWQIIRL